MADVSMVMAPDDDRYFKMKRILVLADTHRNVPMAQRVIQRSLPLDGLVHLGDLVQDAYELQEAAGLPLWTVSGNHDWHSKEPNHLIFTVEEVRIFACHGDRYDLAAYYPDEEWEENMAAMLRDADKAKARCVLFGHSHVALCQEDANLLVMNPGSMLLGEREASYGLLEIDGDQVAASLARIPQTIPRSTP